MGKRKLPPMAKVFHVVADAEGFVYAWLPERSTAESWAKRWNEEPDTPRGQKPYRVATYKLDA